MAYLGGSAFAMARDICEGYVLLSLPILKRMSREEIKQLRFEVERLLTSIRGEQPPQDDINALQHRNRKISRLNSVVTMINSQLQSR
jgi:hypothetical protein